MGNIKPDYTERVVAVAEFLYTYFKNPQIYNGFRFRSLLENIVEPRDAGSNEFDSLVLSLDSQLKEGIPKGSEKLSQAEHFIYMVADLIASSSLRIRTEVMEYVSEHKKNNRTEPAQKWERERYDQFAEIERVYPDGKFNPEVIMNPTGLVYTHDSRIDLESRLVSGRVYLHVRERFKSDVNLEFPAETIDALSISVLDGKIVESIGIGYVSKHDKRHHDEEYGFKNEKPARYRKDGKDFKHWPDESIGVDSQLRNALHSFGISNAGAAHSLYCCVEQLEKYSSRFRIALNRGL